MTLLAITRIGTLASGGLAGFGSGASAMVGEVSRQRSLSGSGGAAATTADATLLLTRSFEGVGSAASEADGHILALTSKSVGGEGRAASNADAAMSRTRGLTGAGAAAAETEGELVPTGVTVAIAGTSSEADSGSGTHVTPFFLYTAVNDSAIHKLIVLDMFYPKPKVVWHKNMEARSDPNNDLFSNGPDETEKTSIFGTTLYISGGFGKELFEYDFALDETTYRDIDWSLIGYADNNVTPKGQTHQDAQYMWMTIYAFASPDPEEMYLVRIDKTTWAVDLVYLLASGSGLTPYGTWPGVAWDRAQGNLFVSTEDEGVHGDFHRIDPADGSVLEILTGFWRPAVEHHEAQNDWWGADANTNELIHILTGGTAPDAWNFDYPDGTSDIDFPDREGSGHFYRAVALSKAIHYVTRQIGGVATEASAADALSAKPTLVGSGDVVGELQADLTNYRWRWLTDGPGQVSSWDNVLDDSYGVGWRAKVDVVVHKMRVWGEGTFSGHISLRVGDPNNVVVTQPVEFVANQWSEVFAGDYPILADEECWVVAHAQGAAIARDISADYGEDNFFDLYDGRTFLAEPSATWAVVNASDDSPNTVVSHATGLAEDWLGVDIMFIPGTNDNTFMGGSSDGASTMANADLTVTSAPFQWIRPDSWANNSGWSARGGSFMDQVLDEPSPNDSDYIDDNQGAETIDYSMTNPDVVPSVDTGHIVRVRMGKSAAGGNDRSLLVEFREGLTVIGSQTFTVPDTFTTFELTLTEVEAASITDYTNVRVFLESGGTTGGPGSNRRNVFVSWLEVELPK